MNAVRQTTGEYSNLYWFQRRSFDLLNALAVDIAGR